MLGVGIDVPGPAPSLRSVPQDRAQPVHVDQGLAGSVENFEAARYLLDLPGRWETALCHICCHWHYLRARRQSASRASCSVQNQRSPLLSLILVRE
jgi:hypothetical protein